MRVLFVVSWYTAYDAEKLAAGVFHYEQAMALKKYCDTALFYPFDPSIPTDFHRAEERGLLTWRSRWTPGERLKNRMRAYRAFARVLREFKPDVIHAHVASSAGCLAVEMGKLYGIPVVITEHNAIELMGLESKKTYLRNRFAYHNSRENICVSEDSRSRLQALFPKERFRVIYNGIQNPADVPADGKQYAREGFINCCIVAAFYDKQIKGYQYLLPALQRLVREGLPILLHIVGGGTYLDDYQKLARELGIAESCVFYGQCDRVQVYSILRQMDFSISASILECSGVSVQEAMLLGKPLVVTKSGGANSLVSEETAIVVERESVEALADGMREMIAQRGRFDPERIAAYAYPRFEIDQVSRQYMELYRTML